MKDPIRVAVTGAAGNIGYALVFRLASGQVFGPDQPVIVNPGNPSAPPIFPCGICRKEVQEHEQVETSS